MPPGKLCFHLPHVGPSPSSNLHHVPHLPFPPPNVFQPKSRFLACIPYTPSPPHRFFSCLLIEYFLGSLACPYQIFLRHFFFFKALGSWSVPCIFSWISLSLSSFISGPFELQMTAGCELLSRAATKSFFQVADQGSDFLSLQNPSPEGDSRTQSVCDPISQCEGIKGTVHRLIRNTCPRFALMLGKWISRGKVSSAPSSTLFLYSFALSHHPLQS